MAETKIRGITVELGADTSGIQQGLKNVNEKIKDTQKQLTDVNRLLKFDPKNTELLIQKQKLLEDQIAQTENKLNVLKEAEKQLKDAGVDQNSEQFMALQREIASVNVDMKKLTEQSDQTADAMKKVSDNAEDAAKKAKALADTSERVGQVTKGINLMAAAGVAALAGLAYQAVVASDDLNTLAKQTGFSTEELQKFKYAADIVDVSSETITGSIQKMKRNMDSTSADVQEAFARIGVAVEDENGNFRDAIDVFYEVLEGLSAVGNETERDTLAMQIFGKSANQLAGIVDDGGRALKQLGDEAQAAGLILSQETLDDLNKVNDTLDRLKAKAQAGFAQLGAKAALKVGDDVERLADRAGEALGWLIDNFETVAAVVGAAVVAFNGFNAAMAISNAVTAYNTGIKALSGTITAATKVQHAWNAAMNANVIGATVTAVALLATGIIALSGAMGGNKKATYELTEEQKKNLKVTETWAAEVSETAVAMQEEAKALRETADAYEELREKTYEAAYAEDVQFDKLQELWLELDEITEANGRVKDGYSERAGFILNELNNALDTEYTMNGQLIDQYGTLKKSIGEVIASKRADALLSAYDEQYREALVDEQKLSQERVDSLQAVQEAEKKLADARAEYGNWFLDVDAQKSKLEEEIAALEEVYSDAQKKFEERRKKFGLGSAITGLAQLEVDTAFAEVEEAKQRLEDFLSGEEMTAAKVAADKSIADATAALETAQEAFTTVDASYKAALGTIEAYETASGALISGNAGKAVDILQSLTDGFTSATTSAGLSTEELWEKVSDTALAWKLMEKNYQDGVAGVTQEMVDEAKDAADVAWSQWVHAGESVVQGVTAGIQKELQKGLLYKEIKKMMYGMESTAKKAGEINSPSKLFAREIGQYIPAGVAEGINGSMGVLDDSVSAMLAKAAAVDFSSMGASASRIGAVLAHAPTAPTTSSLKLDMSALQGLTVKGGAAKVNVTFGGSLSALAAVLTPYINVENDLLGTSLVD